MTRQQAERQEALDTLRKWIKEGDTVYTVLRHVSRSGMQRIIGVVVFLDGDPIHPNYSVGTLLERAVKMNQDGVVCRGAGMDMGFDLVYSLSHAMFGRGDALKHRWL